LRALDLNWTDLFARGSRRAGLLSVRRPTVVCVFYQVQEELLERERRAAARRARWAHVAELADEARQHDRLITRIREVVVSLGDVPEAWHLADLAAILERLCRNAEAAAHYEVAGRALW
jgi:hypothetical protein